MAADGDEVGRLGGDADGEGEGGEECGDGELHGGGWLVGVGLLVM